MQTRPVDVVPIRDRSPGMAACSEGEVGCSASRSRTAAPRRIGRTAPDNGYGPRSMVEWSIGLRYRSTRANR